MILKLVMRIGLAAVLATVMTSTPAQLCAQSTNKPVAEKKSPSRQKEGEPIRQRKLPYSGNLTAIGKTAKTFTVGKRVFDVCSDTRFFRGEKPAVIGDGVPGEYLTLSYVKSEDGRFIAQNVYFGGKKAGPAGKKPQDK